MGLRSRSDQMSLFRDMNFTLILLIDYNISVNPCLGWTKSAWKGKSIYDLWDQFEMNKLALETMPVAQQSILDLERR